MSVRTTRWRAAAGRAGRRWLAGLLAFAAAAATAFAVDRFPRPQFESGYKLPPFSVPPARALLLEYLDLGVFAAALALATWLALRRRSRRGLVLLMLFAIGWFGFWRKGCICSVGSVQNLALAWADPGYAAPLSAIVLFALPLLVALLWGRTFCAAVCPLGAIQDLVVLRPVRVPGWLDAILRLLPPLYLGLAVLYAASGAGFIVCREDPFVGFYRLGANATLFACGAGMLLLGVFVGRPYCRYSCPYGVLLGWCSSLARRHVTITPDDCVQCRLCEDACPFGAIRVPPPAGAPPEPRPAAVRRLTRALALLPVLVAAGALAGRALAVPLARGHQLVRLGERILAENAAGDGRMTLETETFRSSGRSTEALVAAGAALQRRFAVGGLWLGAFMGAVIGGRLVAASRPARSPDYTPDPETCFSCGRCFAYCPREHVSSRTDTGGSA